ncbi:symmetrical bis(5'-nucleosyl)-tetraphosphatase [Pokkaliibacter sp. CJK22405]|uniref:symmetrical bis(5'-nucleosyl)-tetraphosphatase n=1 Tax=Pokkaliibacter sp. CJK22405 TaxID=3384615 RepID=UPI0039847AE7
MARYVIGDIQGCYDEFRTLLDVIHFSDSDQLWIAGDLVNRGPDSLNTLRFVKSLGDQAISVLGNHDLHLLAIAHGHGTFKRGDTLEAIFAAEDRDELLHWLQHRPLLHRDGRQVLVHAGLPPIWSAADAEMYAREVEEVLRGDDAPTYFAHMYGNQPDRWQDDLEGAERWRVITNYLTRMRFVTPNGRLEFKSKSSMDEPPEGFLPWFLYKNPEWSGSYIYFGHWAALLGQTGMHDVFALDTGCVWGNTLTALRLDDQRLFSVPSLQPLSVEA